MPVISIFLEALTGSLHNVWQMAMVVIPLMIVIEIFQDLNLLDKLTSFVTPLTRLIGLDKEANLPLLAGLFFGISYGAGIIINCARQGKLQIEDIYVINLYLVICHSLFEDTIIFAAIGANWLPIIIGRIILATLVCFFWSRWSQFHKTNAVLAR